MVRRKPPAECFAGSTARKPSGREIGRASCRGRGEISVGVELRCVLFRSHEGCDGLRRPGVVWFGESLPQNALLEAQRESRQAERSEERRVGEEGRSRWEWS